MKKVITVGERAQNERPLFQEKLQNALIHSALNAPETVAMGLGVTAAWTILQLATGNTVPLDTAAMALTGAVSGAGLITAYQGFKLKNTNPEEQPTTPAP